MPISAAATAISAPATAAVSASTAAAAGGTFFPGSRLIYGQRPTLEVFLMEHGNGLARVIWCTHLDEGKAAGTPRSPILHDIHRQHCAGLREIILQVVLCGRKGQVSHE